MRPKVVNKVSFFFFFVMESRDSSVWKILSQKILLLSEMNSFVPNVDNNRRDPSAIDQSERVVQNMVEI